MNVPGGTHKLQRQHQISLCLQNADILSLALSLSLSLSLSITVTNCKLPMLQSVVSHISESLLKASPC